MIETIISLLELNDYIGLSKNIDIAKGINKTPLTFKAGWERKKRLKVWQ
jgi:hypothetical protein